MLNDRVKGRTRGYEMQVRIRTPQGTIVECDALASVESVLTYAAGPVPLLLHLLVGLVTKVCAKLEAHLVEVKT